MPQDPVLVAEEDDGRVSDIMSLVNLLANRDLAAQEDSEPGEEKDGGGRGRGERLPSPPPLDLDLALLLLAEEDSDGNDEEGGESFGEFASFENGDDSNGEEGGGWEDGEEWEQEDEGEQEGMIPATNNNLPPTAAVNHDLEAEDECPPIPPLDCPPPPALAVYLSMIEDARSTVGDLVHVLRALAARISDRSITATKAEIVAACLAKRERHGGGTVAAEWSSVRGPLNAALKAFGGMDRVERIPPWTVELVDSIIGIQIGLRFYMARVTSYGGAEGEHAGKHKVEFMDQNGSVSWIVLKQTSFIGWDERGCDGEVARLIGEKMLAGDFAGILAEMREEEEEGHAVLQVHACRALAIAALTPVNAAAIVELGGYDTIASSVERNEMAFEWGTAAMRTLSYLVDK